MTDHQHQGQPSSVKAILRKIAGNARGYALAVDITPSADVTAWTAELVVGQDATVAAGPGTTVQMQGQVAVLTPTTGEVASGGHGVAYAAISGTTSAPTHARVKATVAGKQEFAKLDGLYVADRRGHVVKATEQTWPGSTKTVTNPDQWSHHGGGGGGGGGGGQFTCSLLVDFQNQTVSHQITSDAGGGGGAGGGSGSGSGGQQQGGDYQYKDQQKRNRA